METYEFQSIMQVLGDIRTILYEISEKLENPKEEIQPSRRTKEETVEEAMNKAFENEDDEDDTKEQEEEIKKPRKLGKKSQRGRN